MRSKIFLEVWQLGNLEDLPDMILLEFLVTIQVLSNQASVSPEGLCGVGGEGHKKWLPPSAVLQTLLLLILSAIIDATELQKNLIQTPFFFHFKIIFLHVT